jgi:hypothetical protein
LAQRVKVRGLVLKINDEGAILSSGQCGLLHGGLPAWRPEPYRGDAKAAYRVRRVPSMIRGLHTEGAVAYAVSTTWHQAKRLFASIVVDISKPYLLTRCHGHCVLSTISSLREQAGGLPLNPGESGLFFHP